MKTKISKLGANLYLVKFSWWAWTPTKGLTEVILKLQEEGKTITSINKLAGFAYRYLIVTS